MKNISESTNLPRKPILFYGKSHHRFINGIGNRRPQNTIRKSKFADFYPNFNEVEHGNELTLRDLAAMEAGYYWDEDYRNPFYKILEFITVKHGRSTLEISSI